MIVYCGKLFIFVETKHKTMILHASKSIEGQELDIVVNYDRTSNEVIEVIEICINKVDVSPTLCHLGADFRILEHFEWQGIYANHINQFK